MALASDLMGLGLPANLALNIAVGGTGPVAVTAAGSAFASATRLGGDQRFAAVGNANGTVAVALPAVAGDVQPTDMFVIGNYSSAGLPVYLSSGVVISAGGTSNSSLTLGSFCTLIAFPVSSTQWVGLST